LTEAPEPIPKRSRLRGRAVRAALLALGGVAVILAGIALAAPVFLRTPEGLALVESIADGLPVRPVGRLEVQGLAGDPLGAFTVRRLAIRDKEGVWIEARALSLDWRPLRLAGREVRVERASAERIRVLRRPKLEPRKPHQALPVTLTLRNLTAVIETDPAFSVRRGAFRAGGVIQVLRDDDGVSARFSAISLLHEGDFANLDLDVGPDRPLRVRAEALEAMGGALAGSVGVAADKPFRLSVTADGQVERGQVRADLRSGDDRPVAVTGGWTPEGGSLTGLVDLSASTLTRPLAERLGPQLRLAGTAKGRPGDRGGYVIDLTVLAETAKVSVRGPVDLEKLQAGEGGLEVLLTAPSLARLLGGGEAGALRIGGRMAGGAEAWRFGGEARVAAIQAAGYQLAEFGGPVTLEAQKGRLDLQVGLRGEGGRGTGLPANLLGRAPTLDLKASRLADGALLIEDLRAVGSGFRVTGEGSRGLLGGLSFSGEAVATRLDLGLPGASGGLSARWSARSGGSQSPWEVSVSARGDNLKTGRLEADRLLGLRPTLDARFALQEGDLRFERIVVEGRAIRANARGGALASGALDVGFDWSASGPFAAGPVEIAGKASGAGRIGGRLATPEVRMDAGFDAIDLPGLKLTEARLEMNWSPAGGAADLKAQSPYGPASAGAAFAFPRGDVRLSEIRVDASGLRVRGEATLGGKGASQADLAIDLSRGAFLAEGTVTGALRLEDRTGSGLWLDADLSARNALSPGETVSVSEGRLTAEGPLERLALRLRANGQTTGGDWNVDGNGLAERSGEGWRIGFDGGGEAAGRRVRTLETARLELDGDRRRARLRIGLDQEGAASLDLALERSSALVTGRLDDVPASFLNPDLAGRLDADFRIEGRDGRLVGASSGRLEGVRSRDSEVALGLNGRFTATLAEEELRLAADIGNPQGMSADGEVTLPVNTRLATFIISPDRERPLRGRIQANGEVKPLWDLFVGGEQTLSGLVQVRGTLGGTLAAPRADGEAEIENGAFTDASTGLVLKNVVLRSRLSESAIRIDRATGADGQGGTLSGSGLISLQEGSASSFRLDLLNFRVIDNELATAIASGQASMTRAADGRVTLKGGLTINRADVTATAPTPTGVTPLAVTEINRPVEVGRRDGREGGGPAVALDVTLKAPEQIYIRGQGLDLEMSVDARVTGTTARPRLTGLARVVRGSYAFADKRFEIDPSGVVYLSEDPARIRLDLAAVRSDPALTAIVRIRGTAERPEITLTSTPPLPTDEIFSQILFGRSASQLSPVETAQLASAVASMAGGGALDVIGNLRGLAGLDRLTFAGGVNGEGLEVSGGKYLTDNVLLIVSGGGRDGGSAQVEWNVSRSLSLISKLSGQGGNTLSVRWRRDY